ncbi:hypothetical protein [Stakelama marina]|uniref:Lipoprotein n=1 Tax=Stakelama marina TaxID=2826939 RepID=A0A8T4IAS2_9SPHN|nr:hypothetical protein [Stakelama marina]MBR0551650.1 hypothetical protein [Stakelama marina]
MFTRISSAILICLLATGCGEGLNGTDGDPSNQKQTKVACALDGTDDFKPQCSFDEVAGDKGTILTLHEPDGGFHRLRITRDGRGVVAADGAAPAIVKVVGDHQIEVTIDNSRYRLPATIGPVRAK